MAKDHLKRLAAPKTWPVDRKHRTFITRPFPGRSFELAIPLNQLMKKVLGKGATTKEVKDILQHGEVHVNGKRVHTHRRPVGFMDVVTFPDIKEHYVVTLSKQGRLTAVAIDAKQADSRVAKIRGKTRHAGKIQINCYDGTNVLVDKDSYKVGDSVIIKDGKIAKHLPMEKGATIMLTGGRHLSDVGTVTEVDGRTVIFDVDGQELSTARRHAYVVGGKEPEVTIR